MAQDVSVKKNIPLWHKGLVPSPKPQLPLLLIVKEEAYTMYELYNGIYKLLASSHLPKNRKERKIWEETLHTPLFELLDELRNNHEKLLKLKQNWVKVTTEEQQKRLGHLTTFTNTTLQLFLHAPTKTIREFAAIYLEIAQAYAKIFRVIDERGESKKNRDTLPNDLLIASVMLAKTYSRLAHAHREIYTTGAANYAFHLVADGIHDIEYYLTHLCPLDAEIWLLKAEAHFTRSAFDKPDAKQDQRAKAKTASERFLALCPPSKTHSVQQKSASSWAYYLSATYDILHKKHTRKNLAGMLTQLNMAHKLNPGDVLILRTLSGVHLKIAKFGQHDKQKSWLTLIDFARNILTLRPPSWDNNTKNSLADLAEFLYESLKNIPMDLIEDTESKKTRAGVQFLLKNLATMFTPQPADAKANVGISEYKTASFKYGSKAATSTTPSPSATAASPSATSSSSSVLQNK